jgi:adenylate cyclase
MRQALDLLDDLIAEAESDPSREEQRIGFTPQLWLLGLRAETLIWVGRLDAARADLQTMAAAVDEWHQTDLINHANKAWVDLHWMSGNVDAARDAAARGVEFAEQCGSPYSVTMAYAALGCAQLMDARAAESVAAYDRALYEARSHRVGLEFEARMLAERAQARLADGDGVGARSDAVRAGEVAREKHARVLECQASIALAQVETQVGREESQRLAAESLGRAMVLARETGALALEPLIRTELANLADLRGDEELALAERSAARASFEKMGAKPRAAALG